MISRIVIACIICLSPVLVYCLILIGFNSRRRASMIPGPWDFAGVLFATSGFLLAGGPLMLAGLNAGWRRYILRGTIADWRTLSGQGDALALAIWAAYFFVIVGGCALLLWRRRNVTVLYNVDTEHFPAALEWVFGRLGVTFHKAENNYELKRSNASQSAVTPWRHEQSPADIYAPAARESHAVKLRVNVLPSSRNVTMIWRDDERDLRNQVEAEISRLLPNIRADENPALGWLVTAATTLFGLMVFGLIFVIMLAIRTRGSLSV